MVDFINRKSMLIRYSGRSSDYITPSFGYGCLLNCSYCYMKRHLGKGLTIANNHNDILTAINNHSFFDQFELLLINLLKLYTLNIYQIMYLWWMNTAPKNQRTIKNPYKYWVGKDENKNGVEKLQIIVIIQFNKMAIPIPFAVIISEA